MAANEEEAAEGAAAAPAPAEAKQELEIIDVRSVPSTEPERAGKIDTLITYQLDPQHVYMIRVPKEEVPPEEIDKAVLEDYRRKRGVIGRTISV